MLRAAGIPGLEFDGLAGTMNGPMEPRPMPMDKPMAKPGGMIGGLLNKFARPNPMQGAQGLHMPRKPQMNMRKPLQMPNFNRTSVPMGGNQSIQRQNMMQRPTQRPMRMMF